MTRWFILFPAIIESMRHQLSSHTYRNIPNSAPYTMISYNQILLEHDPCLSEGSPVDFFCVNCSNPLKLVPYNSITGSEVHYGIFFDKRFSPFRLHTPNLGRDYEKRKRAAVMSIE